MSRAKSVVFDLLSPRGQNPMAVAAILEACGLFGISPNNARVTLSRLTARGLLVRTESGEYALSPSAAVRNNYVLGWSRKVVVKEPWNGRWIAVHLKKPFGTRTREKAMKGLALLKFAMAAGTLAVRPNNFDLDDDSLADEFARIGVGRPAIIFNETLPDSASADRWMRLWKIDAMRAGYDSMADRLRASLSRLSTMPFERALVECFTLGGAAIRHLALDPALPEEMMPGRERERLRSTMIDYDRAGRALWRKFNSDFAARTAHHQAPFQNQFADSLLEVDTP